jgi:hypothetical protein
VREADRDNQETIKKVEYRRSKLDFSVSHYGVAAVDIIDDRLVKMVFALEPIEDMTATVTARMIPRMTAYSTRAAPSSFLEKLRTELSNLRIISTSGLRIAFLESP